jgi:two-component system alkaline phosphatase synthesis response regulator PhoP
MTQRKLLVVDDEPDIREALESVFSSDYEVHFAGDGMEALDQVREIEPDLVLLDIMMPRMDGFQTCLRLRQNEATRHIPIIFLTTKTEPQTESFGLDLGADDFIVKPFNVEVLKARVRRRMNGGHHDTPGEVTKLGDYTVYWDRQEATWEDEHIILTTKEINLLRMFVQNPHRVLSRESILERVWADTFITDRTIDSHVKELRKKIPPLVKLLKTVYGAGYRLDL